MSDQQGSDTPQYCIAFGNKVTGATGRGKPSADYKCLMAWVNKLNKEYPYLLHDVVHDRTAEDWVAGFPRTASEVFPEYQGSPEAS